MAKKKFLFSWPKFWENELVSAIIPDGARTTIVLTFNSVKPFTNCSWAKGDRFTLSNAGGRAPTGFTVSTSAKTVTITGMSTFSASTDAPTYSFDPIRKGATVSTKSVTNAIPFDYIAPTTLVAVHNGKDKMDLTWACLSTNEDGFVLCRSITDETHYADLSTVINANATSVQDTGLAHGTKYYYKIKSKHGAYVSAYSASANDTTQSD